jgi:hypothetical protein
MATEGINLSLAAPAAAFARHTVVAIGFNMIFAVGLAFFWLILRDGPAARTGVGDYAVWILASLAHLWYYSSENTAFKIVVVAVSLAVNATVLVNIERLFAA